MPASIPPDQMGLYAEKEVLAVLGDHFVGAVGKTQLLCQALGPLRVVVRENTGFCGLTHGMGDGAPMLPLPMRPKVYSMVITPVFGRWASLGPRIWRSAGRNREGIVSILA